MSLFPLFLKLKSHRVLVVGGGSVAEAKIGSLLLAEAVVTVVAPEVNEIVRGWHGSGQICWLKREFREADVADAILVIAATNRSDVNHSVYRAARQAGILCNVVDDPDHCDFYFPAIVRRGDLQIAVSTGGQSPSLARQIRQELEEQFGPAYERWIMALGEQRRVLREALPPGPIRNWLLDLLAQQRPLSKRRALRSVAGGVTLATADQRRNQ